MNLNKVYRALYLYHEDGRLNFHFISEKTGLSPKQIRKVIKGEAFPRVYRDFMIDMKKDDFSRTYKIPNPRNLTEGQYDNLKNKCLMKIIHLGFQMRDIRGYLVEQDIREKDIDKLLNELVEDYSQKISEAKEKKLKDILNVLVLPTKKGIDFRYNIVDLYPHPKLNDYNMVTGVEYKLHKSFLMPEELFDFYCDSEDKSLEQPKKEKRGRPNKYPAEMIEQWVKMREFGCTYREIGKKFGVNPNVVTNNISKMKKVRES
ncbi:hypothetical protein [Priestia megaterium]|uniref:hypothetical protein n=1 Tax=Priestia megaterium TaxID=1404 RepID=UPI00263B4071|nr:hypothetical protein [Priestia megaterium]MDN4862880.1 hypothetical protein [Priestia megaterium]